MLLTNPLKLLCNWHLPSSAASLADSKSKYSRLTSQIFAKAIFPVGRGVSLKVVGGILDFGSSTRASSLFNPSEFTLCTAVRCFWILDFSENGSWQRGQAMLLSWFGCTVATCDFRCISLAELYVQYGHSYTLSWLLASPEIQNQYYVPMYYECWLFFLQYTSLKQFIFLPFHHVRLTLLILYNSYTLGWEIWQVEHHDFQHTISKYILMPIFSEYLTQWMCLNFIFFVKTKIPLTSSDNIFSHM